jgi:hypothetical protein
MPPMSETITSARSGNVTVVEAAWMNSIRSATPFARATSRATWIASSGSIAYTRPAPAWHARSAKMPVPVPMSTTVQPGRTACRSARWNASMRTRSPIIKP